MARKLIRNQAVHRSSPRPTVSKREINAVDYYFLIHCCMLANRSKKIGWNHADTVFLDWLNQLSQKNIEINDEHLEDALYAANMLNEAKLLKHPTGAHFTQILKKVLKKDERFDRLVNVIVKEDKK